MRTLETLNSSNYQVDLWDSNKDYEGHYYLQDGIRSLWQFTKLRPEGEVDFKKMLRTIQSKGHFTIACSDGYTREVSLI